MKELVYSLPCNPCAQSESESPSIPSVQSGYTPRYQHWKNRFQVLIRPCSHSTLSLLGVYHLIGDMKHFQGTVHRAKCYVIIGSQDPHTGSVKWFLTLAAHETPLGCLENSPLPGPFPQSSYTEFRSLEWIDESVCPSMSSSANLGWDLDRRHRDVVRMNEMRSCV